MATPYQEPFDSPTQSFSPPLSTINDTIHDTNVTGWLLRQTHASAFRAQNLGPWPEAGTTCLSPGRVNVPTLPTAFSFLSTDNNNLYGLLWFYKVLLYVSCDGKNSPDHSWMKVSLRSFLGEPRRGFVRLTPPPITSTRTHGHRIISKEAKNPSVWNNELIILQGKSPDRIPRAKPSLPRNRKWLRMGPTVGTTSPESRAHLPMIPGAHKGTSV